MAAYLDIETQAAGLLNLRDELGVVDGLTMYLESCMQPSIRDDVRQAAASYELGWNKKTGRVGVLFPSHLVDMRLGQNPNPDAPSFGSNVPA